MYVIYEISELGTVMLMLGLIQYVACLMYLQGTGEIATSKNA